MNSTNEKHYEGLAPASADAERTALANPAQTVYYPTVRVKPEIQNFLSELVRKAKSPQAGSVLYVQMPKGLIMRVEVKELGE